MRILHVTTSFEPAWHEGGIVRAEVDYLRSLREAGVDVQVFTTTYAQNRPSDLVGRRIPPQATVPTHYFPIRGPGRFAYSPALRESLRLHVPEFDLVHIHGVWTYPCLAAASAARRAGVPYVLTTHGALDPWSFSRRTWRRHLHLGLGGRKMLTGSAFIHCTTDRERDKVAQLGLPLRFLVLPLILRTDAMAEPLRLPGVRPPGLAANVPWILFFSRVHPLKGLDLLLEALAICRDMGRRAVLSVVGPEEASYGKRLRRMIRKLELDSRVLFHGPVYSEERLAYLRDASLLCLTSHKENFGLVVAEAAACGTPSLISDQVDLAPWVLENGLGFVCRMEPDDIAKRLDAALADPVSLREMGRRASLCVRRDFSPDGVSRQLIAAYKGVLRT